MKLLQTLFSAKISKSDQPAEMSIPIEQMTEILVRDAKFHLDMTQLEQKHPDFAAQLKLKVNDNQVIEITDIIPSVFDLMMKYVYDDEKPSNGDLDKYGACLLVAANKYKIEPLKQICECFLARGNFSISFKRLCKGGGTNPDAILSYLKWAITNDAHLLKSDCLRRINFRFDKYEKNQQWLDLVESRPSIYRELYEYKFPRTQNEMSHPKYILPYQTFAANCFLFFVFCLLWTCISLSVIFYNVVLENFDSLKQLTENVSRLILSTSQHEGTGEQLNSVI